VDFRWVAFITLWTFLVGPIFGAGGPALARKPAAVKSVKPAPAKAKGVPYSCASGNSGPRSFSSSLTTVWASSR
jgi:hypothetical protein